MIFGDPRAGEQIQGKKLRALLEQRCGGNLGMFKHAIKGLVEAKRLTLDNCDLPTLWRTFVLGDAHIDGSPPQNLFEAASLGHARMLREADFGVRATGFLDITGQLIFSSIRESFEAEAPVFAPLIGQEKSAFLDAERVPEVVPLSDADIQPTAEGQRIPEVELGEAFYTLPAKQKRGGIVSLTKELLFAMQATKLNETLRKKSAAIGTAAARQVENEIIDVITGTTNNYVRNGTAENTFQLANSINDAVGTTLVDWTDVEAAIRLFDDLTHPDTGESLAMSDSGLFILCSPALLYSANRITRATDIRTDTNEAAGNTKQEFIAPNPLPPLQVASSRRYKQRLVNQGGFTAAQADGLWILCNPKLFVSWIENWGITLEQQAAQSNAGFERDIEARWKATYRGVAAVRERRAAVRQRV